MSQFLILKYTIPINERRLKGEKHYPFKEWFYCVVLKKMLQKNPISPSPFCFWFSEFGPLPTNTSLVSSVNNPQQTESKNLVDGEISAFLFSPFIRKTLFNPNCTCHVPFTYIQSEDSLIFKAYAKRLLHSIINTD